MSRVVAIVNGSAAGGRAAKRAGPLLERIGSVEVQRTEGPGHATALAREAAEAGAEVVIAVGGDGTVFEVANGLLPATGVGDEGSNGSGPAMGVLPLGTGNCFVRDLGIEDPERAADAIVRGSTRAVDAVRMVHAAGELWSVNIVSFGFSADVGELTNRRYKPFGAGGYVLAVFQTLLGLRYHAYPHALDGGAFDGRPVTLLSFCNTRYTGGDMKMAPDADPSDGELDVVRIGTMRRRRLLASFPRIFQGTHHEMPEVEVGRARRVTFAAIGPVPIMIDGEIRLLEPRTLEVAPRVLRVLA
jgi:diacylglycerol kinase (ATP)